MNNLKRFGVFLFAVTLLIGCSNTKNKKEKDQVSIERSSGNISDDLNKMYMLVGTYTSGNSKGIYVYKLDTITGESSFVSEAEVDNPSYLVLDKAEKYVYAVTEDESNRTAAANAFSFDKKTGLLQFINKRLTGGGAPCYINVDDKGHHVITANYLGGSITAFNVRQDGGLDSIPQQIIFSGKGIDKERQTQPHLHCVQFSPDYKYLFADDLGTDKIYKFNVKPDDSTYLTVGTPVYFKIKDGSGPRHLIFHPNQKYAYLLTEISGDVVVFDYMEGNLQEKQTIKADSLNARGSGDIQISPDGRFLYASNRLKGDGIAVFSIDQNSGLLTKIAYQPTGVHPRNLIITPSGGLLLVANRDDNDIQVFKRNTETGLLINLNKNIDVDKPVCIKFASLK